MLVGSASSFEECGECGELIENIGLHKVSIGFTAALLVLAVNAFSIYKSIGIITNNNRSIDEIHRIATSLDRMDRIALDRLQSESKQSLADTKSALEIAGLLDLLLLVFLYGSINWDLTKKQQAESTLRDAVAEFEELYHSAPCGYHSLDPTGKIVQINRTELQMLGYAESEIIECKQIVDLLTPESITTYAENFPLLKTRGWIHDIELQMIRKDGQIVPVSATVVGLHDPQGNYLGNRTTVIDISDRVRLRNQAQIQHQELIRSNAELEQFAHIASHDLQEPLRMVISYLQLLERRYQGKLDRDADEFIDYAVDGAIRMQTLIQALLSYARVSSRKQPFELVKCDLVLQDAISNLHVAITESAAIISHDSLPTVWGDATQLTQVFQNLIANAIKFRREIPPEIHISVELNPSGWCFAIADNGIGIESQYLDRIFVIFQRLHTRISYPGTGIGLAICKKIVERHGGTIWVESIPTQLNSELSPPLAVQPEFYGSIFYFTIPDVGSIAPHYANKQPHH
jgi:PAS domain S-box-containing protein